QLRRLGAPSINLFSHEELCEEEKQRDAAEGLRLFHVAVTRARDRLILSGVVRPEPANGSRPGTPLIERIVDGFGIDRGADSSVAVPAPEPRPGLDATFAPSQIAVRVNLPSPERAAELVARRREAADGSSEPVGPAPLIDSGTVAPPPRPLSYTAISAAQDEISPQSPTLEGATEKSREEATGRGAAVHGLLEWSQAHGWRQPDEALVRRHALAAGLDPDAPDLADELLGPVRAWLGSAFLRERVRHADATVRSEVPLLLEVAGTVLRGSIDLLIERPGAAPLIVDYKTDRLDGGDPAGFAARYETQRDIYALAVAEARGAGEVEVAYIFLERPESPVVRTLGAGEIEAARHRLEASVERIAAGYDRSASAPA
ncbi:MAG TPA: PD-(D/E)XK nuclease family protein, partial [Solirubrobacterales bacterium]|nr:PD-(D/E)XK nuclease family protein [Solirubrobacterales bacterium]